MELRAAAHAEIPGRRSFGGRHPRGGRRLQRQAGLGHDHGHGRHPGPVPRAGAPPGQPPRIPRRRPVAAGARTPGNLLHQGPAADPRNRPGNPPRPAAQQRARRAQGSAAADRPGQRLRHRPEEQPVRGRPDPRRLLRPVARAVGGRSPRAGAQHPRPRPQPGLRRRPAHRLAGHRPLPQPQGRPRPGPLARLGRPVRLGRLRRHHAASLRPGPAAGLVGHCQPAHRAGRLRRAAVQLLVLPRARRAHRRAGRRRHAPRRAQHDRHAVRPADAVRRQAQGDVRRPRHGPAAAAGHRRPARWRSRARAGGAQAPAGLRRPPCGAIGRRRAVRHVPPGKRAADLPRRAGPGGQPGLAGPGGDRQAQLLGAGRPPARPPGQPVLGRRAHAAQGRQAGDPRAQPGRRGGAPGERTGRQPQRLAVGQAAPLPVGQRRHPPGAVHERRPTRQPGEHPGLPGPRSLPGRRRPQHAERLGLAVGQGLRHLADPLRAHGGRLRPGRAAAGGQQLRAVGQSGKPALCRRHRRLAQGSLPDLAVPGAQPRPRLRQPAPAADPGAVTAHVHGVRTAHPTGEIRSLWRTLACSVGCALRT
ncbi:hypothetical protein OF001_U110116 [Pseudomonas sp. OF001]|nr:hypothetical protein OF001_U110116 [Pseudomonas sp. OF001]